MEIQFTRPTSEQLGELDASIKQSEKQVGSKIRAVRSGPADSQAYSVMAERAFEALAVKIRAAFFRPDSAAFKRHANPAPSAQAAPARAPAR